MQVEISKLEQENRLLIEKGERAAAGYSQSASLYDQAMSENLALKQGLTALDDNVLYDNYFLKQTIEKLMGLLEKQVKSRAYEICAYKPKKYPNKNQMIDDFWQKYKTDNDI